MKKFFGTLKFSRSILDTTHCNILGIIRRKLFNFSLGGNEITPNIKEESATSSICVCVCVYMCKTMCVCVCVLFFIFYFIFFNLKQCVKKKINLKKPCTKQ